MKSLQRIMCVDDNPDIQRVVKIALERLGGFSLKICSSGEEALREAEGFAPEIIILDVMMPGMDGIATLSSLRQNTRLADIPVIFLSAKVQPAEVSHYKSLGALDVISKPFNAATLADQVRAIWQSWHQNLIAKAAKAE